MYLSKEKIVEYIEFLLELAEDKKKMLQIDREDFFELDNEYDKFKKLIQQCGGLSLKFKDLINEYTFDPKAHLKIDVLPPIIHLMVDPEEFRPESDRLSEQELAAFSNIDSFIQKMYVLRIEALKL